MINDNFFDALNLIGVVLNLENLKLNTQQSNELMQEMRSNQDNLLKRIIIQNEIIIEQNRKMMVKMGINDEI